MNNYLPLGKYSLALLTAILFSLASAPALQAKEPVDYVNTFIGAASTRPTEDELARMTAAGVTSPAVRGS